MPERTDCGKALSALERGIHPHPSSRALRERLGAFIGEFVRPLAWTRDQRLRRDEIGANSAGPGLIARFSAVGGFEDGLLALARSELAVRKPAP